MTASASGKPARHINCALLPHCPHCGWAACAAHLVLISRRPGLTFNNEIPLKHGSSR